MPWGLVTWGVVVPARLLTPKTEWDWGCSCQGSHCTPTLLFVRLFGTTCRKQPTADASVCCFDNSVACSCCPDQACSPAHRPARALPTSICN